MTINRKSEFLETQAKIFIQNAYNYKRKSISDFIEKNILVFITSEQKV